MDKYWIFPAIAMLSGCCSTGPMTAVDVDKPVLPRITEEEAKDVPDAVWEKIVKRDLARKQYEERLEIVVKGCTGGW